MAKGKVIIREIGRSASKSGFISERFNEYTAIGANKLLRCTLALIEIWENIARYLPYR